MELESVTIEEVKAFIDSLTVERRFLRPDFGDCLAATEYLAGVRLDGELAAVCGIRRSRRFSRVGFRFPFVAVRSDFQGRGIATVVAEGIEACARERGWSFLLGSDMEGNTRGRILARKHGYRVFYDSGEMCLRILPLNRRGKVLAAVLRVVGPPPALVRRALRLAFGGGGD